MSKSNYSSRSGYLTSRPGASTSRASVSTSRPGGLTSRDSGLSNHAGHVSYNAGHLSNHAGHVSYNAGHLSDHAGHTSHHAGHTSYYAGHSTSPLRIPSSSENISQHSSKETRNELTPNNLSHGNYQTFNVSSSDYDIIFINRNISTDALNELLNHVDACKQYSIDTESERNNNRLALIQINSIPNGQKSIVMLFELHQLPDRNTQKYANIYELFRLLFRVDNEIYSWGKMQVELEQAKDLLVWPIPAKLINLQPYFNEWYNWARTQCRVQDLSYHNDMNGNNHIMSQKKEEISCTCHPPSPYKNNEHWSLQKAFLYGFNLFIDKSYTLSHWSASLSSRSSSLSQKDRTNMINYAVHDVMAVTFLIRPITERWTFDRIASRKMNEIFLAFRSVQLVPIPTSKNKNNKKQKNNNNGKIKDIDMQKFATALMYDDTDIEDISSEDEIYLHQLNTSKNLKDDQPTNNSNNNNHYDEIILVQDQMEQVNDDYALVTNNLLIDNEIVVNNHSMVDDAKDKDEATPPKKQQKNQQRSLEARHRRNHRRNTKLKRKRYYYSIKRKWYPRFPMSTIRKILRLYNINFTHVRDDGEELLIGLKDRQSENTAQHKLPHDIFNRQGYFHYRKKFRR